MMCRLRCPTCQNDVFRLRSEHLVELFGDGVDIESELLVLTGLNATYVCDSCGAELDEASEFIRDCTDVAPSEGGPLGEAGA